MKNTEKYYIFVGPEPHIGLVHLKGKENVDRLLNQHETFLSPTAEFLDGIADERDDDNLEKKFNIKVLRKASKLSGNTMEKNNFIINYLRLTLQPKENLVVCDRDESATLLYELKQK